MKPEIIKGNCHADQRGSLCYNNDFNAVNIKRIYTIENKDTHFIRGWQGHKIEQRWFSAIAGSFHIQLIEIDNWENPATNLKPYSFTITKDNLDVLHVPQGFVSSIQAVEVGSKLLVMADYLLGEIEDEYRYLIDYFKD